MSEIADGIQMEIGRAAIRWLSLRAQCNGLKKQRGQLFCEYEVTASSGALAKPCWRAYDEDGELDAERVWCQPCHDRQKIHQELRSLAASRGAALRNLIRLHKLSIAGEKAHDGLD